jgi:hypothetical protein
MLKEGVRRRKIYNPIKDVIILSLKIPLYSIPK